MNLNWAFFAFILVAFAKGDDTTCDTEFEYFPDPYDCQSYYECIDGIKERSTCPDSFLWDATKNICSTTSDCSQLATSTQEDETTSAGASTDETPTVESTTELVSTDVTSTDWSSTDETTTEWASTDATSTDETTTEPSTCEVNSVEGDSSNCTLYYYCDGNKWITFDCPSDLYWSQALQGCVDFKDSDCDCLEGQFTGDVEDCSKYFSCEVFNWTGPLQCPDDLYWSEELQTCVEFGDSDCKKICINGYFAADDEDCSQYYYCENYNWTGPIECPENLYWSESHQTCVNFGESDCEKICISGYFSGDKEDCSRYYYCQDYNWTGPLNCPQDLYWSNTLNGCVDFGDSDCEKPCQSGNFTGDSQDCQVYYACENYNWTGPIKCPNDLYWSQSFEACVILEESDCSADTTTDIPGTSEEPTSTPEESTSEQPFTDETTTTISQSTEEPTTEQPTSEVSPPDETTTEQPTSEVSPSDESTTEQPTSEVSPSDESTTEQPTSEVSPPDETTTEQVTSEAPTPYETTTEELSTDATTISEPTEETTSSQISTEEPATDSTPTESTTVNPDLPCEVDGEYFPDHYDCHGFYQCIDGVQQHDVCADELLWDVNTEGCSETSDCSQLYTTTSGLNIPTALRIKAIGKGMK